jgi:peptidoglycan/xylan/chitin deacetylase (PgdA/CDA1 family)
LTSSASSRSPAVDAALAAREATVVLWNIGSADWTIHDAAALRVGFARSLGYLERTKGWGGGIVLMHDTHAWTVEAFPQIVADLRARNCALLSTGEELYDLVSDLGLWDPARDAAAVEQEIAQRQRALREDTARRCGRSR